MIIQEVNTDANEEALREYHARDFGSTSKLGYKEHLELALATIKAWKVFYANAKAKEQVSGNLVRELDARIENLSNEVSRLNNLTNIQKAHLLQYEADLNTSKNTIEALKAEVDRLKDREDDLMERLGY